MRVKLASVRGHVESRALPDYEKLMFNMAEVGMEMVESSDEPLKPDADVEEKVEFLNTYRSSRRNYRSALATFESVSVNGLSGIWLKPGSMRSFL